MDRFKPYRFLAWSKPVRSRRSASFSLIIFATALLTLSGCNRTGEESGAYLIAYNTSGLPNVTLTDQYGQHVPLASLKGKPLLFDFIYTSCPGPCQLLTLLLTVKRQRQDIVGAGDKLQRLAQIMAGHRQQRR